MYEVVDVSVNTDAAVRGRQGAAKREGLMLHTTDGVNSLGWLQGDSAREGRPASADFLVKRDGTIYRLMPAGYFAYHAGVCVWHGIKDTVALVSRKLYGIEVENADSAGQIPTLDQHRAVAGLGLVLAAERLTGVLTWYGHYGLAYPMGRRSDPRSWDWGFMMWLMAHAPQSCQLYGDLAGIGE